MKPTTSLLPLLLHLPTTLAWGTLGHQTVGYIAQSYLSTSTISWAKSVLETDSSASYLASIASWADEYRYTSAGRFSAPFHFIDANDSPPQTCNVDLTRDCHAEGCVVSAIANYTAIVQDSDAGAEDRKEALQFLVHFFGDVTQPLHDEALEVGGNDIPVTFNGEANNLHHIWDTEIPQKIAGVTGSPTLADAKKWAETLKEEIDSGDYEDVKGDWVSDLDLDDVTGSGLAMAQDANAFVCSYTLKGGVNSVEQGDLAGQYYDQVAPVVSMQIAKGGYRLAAWLNLIVTGSTGLD